jgi:hypothetical protein
VIQKKQERRSTNGSNGLIGANAEAAWTMRGTETPSAKESQSMDEQSTRGLIYLRTPKVKTIQQIWSEILRYCELNSNVSWIQESYKSDFFSIFADAFYSGHCGYAGNKKLAKARKNRKRKKSQPEEFFVSPATIRAFLKENWAKPKQRMIDDLLVWWEEWTYAWSHHPPSLHRPYVRRKKYDLRRK